MIVSCRNLTRTVPNNSGTGMIRILQDVSLDFLPGTVTVLLGPSGCGKSTLLKALCGLEHADSSKDKSIGVFYDGLSFYDNMESLTPSFAYVPQYENWLYDELTVYDTIRYTQLLRSTVGSRNANIYGALHRLGTHDKERSRLAQLSGGQKKRIAITAALGSEPNVLFLDEPTAPLDPGVSGDFVSDLVERTREKNLTTIMVTHDPNALKGLGNDSHVVMMERGGKVLFDGSYPVFMERVNAKYASFKNDDALQRLYADISNGASLDFLALPSVSGESKKKNIAYESTPEKSYSNGFVEQLWILFRREISLLGGNPLQTLFLFAIPLLLGVILGIVVSPNLDELYEGYGITKAMMFAFSACAFFIGVFDSISLFSNRTRTEVETLHGLNIHAYVLSVTFLYSVITWLQSLVLYQTFVAAVGKIPDTVLYNSGFDMFLTVGFCSFSAMTLGLLCSSLFSHSTYVAPVLVLLQIVFSGIIFPLDGVASTISNYVSCHWAMNGLAAICNLNNLPVPIDLEGIGIDPDTATSLGIASFTNNYNEEFVADKYNLFSSWLALIVLGVIALLLCLLIMDVRRKQLFDPNYLHLQTLTRGISNFASIIQHFAKKLLVICMVVLLGLIITNGINFNAISTFEEFFSYLWDVISDIPSFVFRLLFGE